MTVRGSRGVVGELAEKMVPRMKKQEWRRLTPGLRTLFLALLFLPAAVAPAATGERMPDRIIVKLKEGAPPFSFTRDRDGKIQTGINEIDAALNECEARRMEGLFRGRHRFPESARQVGLDRIYEVTIPAHLDPERAVQRFENNPFVEYAETIGIQRIEATVPNDSYFSGQWGLSQTNDCDVDAPEAWDIGKGSASVVLAIADTGVDWPHPDLGGSSPYVNGNIWTNTVEYYGTTGVDDDGNGYVDDIRGWDWVNVGENNVKPGEDGEVPDNDPMDFHGHGTHCAGIASAITNNWMGVAGLGWGCRIMPLRVGWMGTDNNGYISMAYSAQAITYAVDEGAVAVNCSWGSTNTGGIREAVNYAVDNGVLLAVAAGNGNTSSWNDNYLAKTGKCIDVAATDQNDIKASFSNYGSWVDVSAPGVSIYSTYYDYDGGNPHTYTYMSGTSMAAPLVVGLIGLIKGFNPALTADQIKTIIFDSCDSLDVKNPGYVGLLGHGRINAFRALDAISSSIQGTVIFKYPGWSQGSASVAYQVRNPGLPPGAPVSAGTKTITVTPGNPASGQLSIPGIRDGTYDVAVKHGNHIAAMVPGVVVAGSDVAGLSFSLWAGDADGDNNFNTVYPTDQNGDNDVDIKDYYTLYYQYQGTKPVTAGYNADFNADGTISVQDYNGLKYGYLNQPNPGNWWK